MYCDDVRNQLALLWDGPPTLEMRRHVDTCPLCSTYLRDLQLVRGGLESWQRVTVPEPSVGFADRVVRQLGNIAHVLA